MKPKHLAPAGAQKAMATKPPPSSAPEHRPTQNALLKDSREGRYGNPHSSPPPFPCGPCSFHLAPCPLSKRSTATALSSSLFHFQSFLKDSSLVLSPFGDGVHFSTSAPNILPLFSWRAEWHSNINSRAGQADLNSFWDSLKPQIAGKKKQVIRGRLTSPGYIETCKTWRTVSAG